MKHIEVERKFKVDRPSVIKKRLLDLGAKENGQLSQVDTYFNAPHRNFLDLPIVSEWLRLRDEGGEVSINYKRWLPLGVEQQTHCDEFESVIEDGEAVRKLLEALGFTEMVTVVKLREELVLGDSFVIAIDSVEGLGSFVEFEYKGRSDSIESANQELSRLIDEIGVELGERDRRGYPYQLLGRQR